ncbi:uncharacterized protein [Spinacia oleracea]|uniref:Uncharacterized protein n=1 Tax=Spinacia oleracea TaxID=3562 RepID=A0ABM3QM52_SPIOL|nr:uncharacterized protein LOC130460832 [Spinacia oleracea]XP_056694115.1 uncharacterized protein LOC130469182 [Spinacia oleracea]
MEDHPMYPYNLRMGQHEDIPPYVERVKECCEEWGDLLGDLNNYDTHARIIDILLKTIPRYEPWIPIMEMYDDVLTEEGEIHPTKYRYEGQWFLTIEYVSTRLMEAWSKWEPEDEMGEVIDAEPPALENEGIGGERDEVEDDMRVDLQIEEDPEEDPEEEDPEEEDPEEEFDE